MEKIHFFTIKRRVFSFFLLVLNLLRRAECFILGGEECVCCGKESSFLPLCPQCIKKLTESDFPVRCKVCGKELISEIELCSSCRNEKILQSVDLAFPLFSYRLWKKNLLFAWKTEEKRVLSPLFASFVFNKIQQIELLEKEKIPVVPVPPRPGKIRKKGWDQIDELCFYLRNLYGVKTLNVLKRLTRFQQKKLNRMHRLEQIKKAFVLKNKKEIKKFLKSPPQKVILIDDVMTTGSTIEACAEELKKGGVKKVIVITLFVVD